jgi:uncharacterized protein (DUF952 family)
MNIYHITTRPAWIDATRNGAYTAPTLATEGFIHCSTAAQVLPVAQQFYRGQRGLLLLVIDTRQLTAEVKWEGAMPPAGLARSAAFPHVYGPIPLEAVVQTLEFEPNNEGKFTLPALPAENGSADST